MTTLKALVNGQWVPVSSSGGGGGGPDEVFIGPNDPGLGYEVWFDTDDVPMLGTDQRWNTAWGIVALGTVAGAGNVTVAAPATNTSLTNTVTWTALAGRRYKLSFRITSAYISVGPATACGVAFAIVEGTSTVFGDGDQWMWVGGQYSGGYITTHFNGDGASHTLKGICEQINATSGTTVIFGVKGVVIEDVGPVAGSSPGVVEAWASYTPVLGGTGWAIGDGTALGRYIQVGKTTFFRVAIGFGASSTFGSGALTVTLPVLATTAVAGPSITASFIDSAGGIGVTPGVALLSNTTCRPRAIAVSGGLTHTSIDTTTSFPFAWANGDGLSIFGVYEAA